MKPVAIRAEQPGDEATIHTLTEAAFRTMPFSDGDEQQLVDQLRRDGDLSLSLVALDSKRIAGHIAFSRVTISDGSREWYGLGPVSVWPELQRQGIGSQLIEAGLAQLRLRDARGVVLLGNPDYYALFGFKHDSQLCYPGPPPEYFQRLVLAGEPPKGIVSYCPAFS